MGLGEGIKKSVGREKASGTKWSGWVKASGDRVVGVGEGIRGQRSGSG